MSSDTIHEKRPTSVTLEGDEQPSRANKVEAADIQVVNNPSDEPPDGGYGWIIVICAFWANAVTWGVNSAFGVYLSFYTTNNFFPGATNIDFAFIGGLSVGCAMLIAPIANYLSKRYNFKVPLTIGVIVYTLSQIFSGLSTTIWQLFLTQGIMFGIGVGLIFVPISPLSNQWFSDKRALATGLLAGGSGAGTIIFAQTTQAVIVKLGLRWAFFINAIISFVILVPVVILMKSRVHIIQGKFEPIQYQLLWHPGFLWVWLWGFFTILGYLISLYTVATFATAGLGLSQSQGAAIQSILAAGQMVGRPLAGLFMDRWGRINLAIIWTFISGLSCFVIWIVARSFSVLAFFGFVQGLSGGIFWSAGTPITTEIIGLKHLGSALSILWLSIVLPSIFAEPIAVWLLQEAQRRTGITLPSNDSSDATTNTNVGVSGAGTGDTSAAVVFQTPIGFAGAMFMVGTVLLYGAKRWKQGNWKIGTKT
ncbi:hypothetical protein M422DRAFT_46225 [Sphaerobolus stellatus SS14]|uniref:Major facilitator superfamily (MFS) profile domain-containing protein n=1 Tax=Sphaerobolus stellatus (strain SS14) TaxID=990650 RepID=A0A0C9VU21_SPHS4|nr:hypothetical protein M422DRAFT_46225 [Sphaerobolus stellatus SS14]